MASRISLDYIFFRKRERKKEREEKEERKTKGGEGKKGEEKNSQSKQESQFTVPGQHVHLMWAKDEPCWWFKWNRIHDYLKLGPRSQCHQRKS